MSNHDLLFPLSEKCNCFPRFAFSALSWLKCSYFTTTTTPTKKNQKNTRKSTGKKKNKSRSRGNAGSSQESSQFYFFKAFFLFFRWFPTFLFLYQDQTTKKFLSRKPLICWVANSLFSCSLSSLSASSRIPSVCFVFITSICSIKVGSSFTKLSLYIFISFHSVGNLLLLLLFYLHLNIVLGNRRPQSPLFASTFSLPHCVFIFCINRVVFWVFLVSNG